MTTVTTTPDLLSEEMLTRFDERAPVYDRENRFFAEDFEELRQAGFFLATLPPELGGRGMTLAEYAPQLRRIAYHAPATALGVNMHHYFVGLAADLHRRGDHSNDFVLRRAAEGDIFAAGHGEVGNDVPLLFATSQAERVDGGWEITGHKIFGSLSPVWTWLGIHAMDTSDPDAPQVIHAFVHRDSPRYHIKETWDTLGMRATMSNDTIFDKAFVPDEQVVVTCPAGFAGAGPFHVALFAWALLGFGSVYAGIAQRIYDETVARMHKRTSLALTRSMAHHPEVQHHVAEMRMALETVDAVLERTAADWSNGVDYGHDWLLKILSAKYTAVNLAWSVADTAFDLTGGGGIFKRDRFERLFRDARLGRIHPGNSLLTHEVVAKLSLGIDPDEQPRWG
ncbi:MAG TPA: acyl-CoA dehydrogenase family protein [Acidimicrobiales bacterium]|jgi:alkylation response protein AidB-like acyl-CoA dehydrogenase|nr:acyl-CoA dehydrogenase family protein [Acidimicrobiales bacterium]